LHIADGTDVLRERPLRLQVEGMDTREKVADFALRLGAALGMRYQRLVAGDPRRIEIEMTASPAPGRDPMPPPEKPANYARGGVGSAAMRIASEQRMPPLDVPRFPSDTSVSRWAPGDEVCFDKPFAGGTAIGCLPVAIGCF